MIETDKLTAMGAEVLAESIDDADPYVTLDGDEFEKVVDTLGLENVGVSKKHLGTFGSTVELINSVPGEVEVEVHTEFELIRSVYIDGLDTVTKLVEAADCVGPTAPTSFSESDGVARLEIHF